MRKILIFILLFSVFNTASAQQASSCVDLKVNLRQGMRDSGSSNIFTMQAFLKEKGYLAVNPTGYFGALTLRSVKAFQTANGVTPTGFVGPLTRSAIQKISCVPTAPSDTEGSVAPEASVPPAVDVPTVPVTPEVVAPTPTPSVPDEVLSAGTTSSLKVRTDGLISVSQNTLTIRGTITGGARTGTQRWFELTKNPNAYMRSETMTTAKKDQRTNADFTDTFTGLEPATTYYARACAENVSLGQKSCGSTVSIKTNN